MAKKGEWGWDAGLEEEADRVARLVLGGEVGVPEGLLAPGPVPVFVLCGDSRTPQVARPRGVLRVWEADPDNGDEDREFIRQLRRTDLPPGSFFVLVCPGSGQDYLWALHTPQAAAISTVPGRTVGLQRG